MIKRKRDEQIDRLHLLTLVYLEGLADPDEVAELQKLIAKSPKHRDLFVETATRARLLSDSSGLTALASGEFKPKPQPAVAGRVELEEKSQLGWIIGIAAAVLIAAAVVGIYFVATATPEPEPVSPYGRSVAVILTSNDAVLRDPDGTSRFINDGDSVRTGPFTLTSGSVEFETRSGVLVRLEAPATLSVLNEGRVRLHGGTVAARVPANAIGFTVDTYEFDVIDLGTEFSVSLDSGGVGRVFVYDGLVELRWRNGRTTRVGAGAGRRVDPDGSLAVIDDADSQGASAFDWPVGRVEAVPVANGLVGYYRFDGHDLRDAAKNLAPRGTLADGVIHNGRIDHIDEIKAMRLRGPDDSVALEFGDPMPACTIARRVWIESLDQQLTGLMMSDPDNGTNGQLHYQIDSNGTLVFHHMSDDRYAFADVIREQDLGRWLHLAVTYDQGLGEIAIYRDGERLYRRDAKNPKPIDIGACRLGRWAGYDPRPLDGAFADLAIYDRALKQDEVKRIGVKFAD